MIFFLWEILSVKGGVKMENYCINTRILSGHGALGALGEMGIRQLLVVADPFFVKNGKAAEVAALAGAEKTEFYTRIVPDPDLNTVAEGVALAREFGPDTVVALGGGSAMDCAKAVCYFSGLAPQLIAVPTTSGSGSEVTDFAVLTHGGVKHPLVDPQLRPVAAILDAGLLEQLPPALVADAGFDAISHALEAYVAKNAGAITDALAEKAFCIGISQLPASFRGDVRVREELHLASCMAGMAFSQAGLGLCHAMSHGLGGQFHVPHGRLNAILLPAVLGCNSAAAGKYAKLARLAGLGGSAEAVAVRNLKNALVGLRQQLNLPGTLAQAGIQPQELWQKLPELREAVLADPCCETNPVPVDEKMVRRVLEEVAGNA